MFQEDLSQLCRLCLENSNEMVDVEAIYDEEQVLTFSECFTICTQIVLSKGQSFLPQNLCKLCAIDVHTAYEFFRKVEESKRVIKIYQEQWKKQKLMAQPHATDKRDKSVVNPNSGCKEITIKVVPNSHVVPINEERLFDQQETVAVNAQRTNDDGEILETVENSVQHHDDGDDDQDVPLSSEELGLPPSEYLEEEQSHMEESDVINNANNSSEEHLAMDDYQNIEELIEVDPDSNQLPTELNDKSNENENHANTWQEAVGTVANECHLPLKEANAEGKHSIPSPQRHSMLLEVSSLPSTSSAKSNNCEIEINSSIIIAKGGNDGEQTPPKAKKTKSTRIRGSRNCDVCGKFFKNNSRMMSHRQSHDPNRKRYNCETCGRDYANKQALVVHIRGEHSKNGYTCPICSKIFAIEKALEIHMRYHTGDFPFVCNICDKKFAQAGHLKTHKNVQHNNARYCCDHPGCEKYFTSSSSLRNHEFTHGSLPFLCEFCQRGYTSKSKLKIHISTKHNLVMTLEELERMRQFQVVRSKLNLVQIGYVE